MDLQQYYIQLGGRVSGPFTVAELVARAQRGRFARHFMVSTDKVNWRPASEFPKFFPGAAGKGLAAGPPAASGHDWFYARGGQEIGPVSRAELLSMISAGEIGPRDPVWTEGMLAWEEVWTVPPLAAWMADADFADGRSLTIRRYSRMAILSLVFAILGTSVLFLVGSFVAVAMGHKALRQIEDSGGLLTGRRMAVAGLVLGYFVLIPGSIALLIAAVLILSYATRVQEPPAPTVPPMRNPYSTEAPRFHISPAGDQTIRTGPARVKPAGVAGRPPAGSRNAQRVESQTRRPNEVESIWLYGSNPNPSRVLCTNWEAGNQPLQFDARLVGMEAYEVMQPPDGIEVGKPAIISVSSKVEPFADKAHTPRVHVQVDLVPADGRLTATVRLEMPSDSVSPGGGPLSLAPREVGDLRKRYEAEEKQYRQHFEKQKDGAARAKARKLTQTEQLKANEDFEKLEHKMYRAINARKWCEVMDGLLRDLEDHGRLHVRVYTRAGYNEGEEPVELVRTKDFPTSALTGEYAP